MRRTSVGTLLVVTLCGLALVGANHPDSNVLSTRNEEPSAIDTEVISPSDRPTIHVEVADNEIAQTRVDRVIVRFEHEVHRTIAEGDVVILEHTEPWHFETGENLRNEFVTIHQVRDGKIARWRDYWDLNTMMAQAPQWWIERLAKASEADFS